MPLQLAEDMATAAPLALTVPVMFLLLPTVTLPKVTVAGDSVIVPAAAPVPEREILTFGLVASEVMATVPVAAPEAVGAKLA